MTNQLRSKKRVKREGDVLVLVLVLVATYWCQYWQGGT